MRRVTGAEFSIHKEEGTNLAERCLYVGDTAAARETGLHIDTLKPEEWHLRTAGQSLILAGGRPRGTIYAVTEFLESEVGLLILDPFTEVVPSSPSLTLQTIERSGRPAFVVRAIFTGFPYGYPAMSGRLIEKFRVWNKNIIDGSEAVGGHARMIPSGVHTFGSFISSKEFALSHPEYFGMDASGTRITDDLGTPSQRNEKMMKVFSAWQHKQCQLGVWDYWRVYQQHPPGCGQISGRSSLRNRANREARFSFQH